MNREDRISILSPELLHIDNNGEISYAANQIWYPTKWGRLAGCGATTTSKS